MGYNPQGIMNIYEIIRRWHAGQSISGIAKTLTLDRKTVRSYIQRATQVGIDRESDLPEEGELLARLHPLTPSGQRQKPAAEQFEPYRQEILELTDDPQDPLTLKSAWQVMIYRHREITASYSSLKRVMRVWKPSTRAATWRHAPSEAIPTKR